MDQAECFVHASNGLRRGMHVLGGPRTVVAITQIPLESLPNHFFLA